MLLQVRNCRMAIKNFILRLQYLMRKILTLILFLLPLFAASAQAKLVASLPWGDSPSQLGLYQDGEYRRGPTFFSLDSAGNMYIADAYKSRVAVFDASSHFVKAVSLPAVSPRTTFFKRTEDGSFILCNDQELSRWSDTGTLIGSSALGLSQAQGFFASGNFLSLWLTQEEGEGCLTYSRDLSLQKLVSMKLSSKMVAAFADDEGRYWFPRWIDQVALYRWKASLSRNAQLVAWNSAGASLWMARESNDTLFYWIDAKGDKIKDLSLPSLPIQKWIYTLGPDLLLYYGLWTAAGFEIRCFANS